MGRGGALKDAMSNIALQRSAIRTARMTSLRSARPLNAALDICVRVPGSIRTPPRCEPSASSQLVAALKRIDSDALLKLQARQVRRGGALKNAMSNNPMQRSVCRAVLMLRPLPFTRPLIGSVRHLRTSSWQGSAPPRWRCRPFIVVSCRAQKQ